MNPEPNQTRGTDSCRGESCPEAAVLASPPAVRGGPHTLYDAVCDTWSLPEPAELPRRVGARARRAALRAKARRLELQGDVGGAVAAYRELAQHCWSEGYDYSEAILAAKRTMELAPDDSFGAELALQFERIGAHLCSVELLESGMSRLAPDDRVAMRRKLAGLCHRAGDAETASVHFTEVARLDPEATDALVAIGTMAGWAPGQVSRERGVLAWHEAARRFKRRGALLAAFESTHRAFELDPASSLAAERLAQELDLLGRRDAADEIWRQSAVAASDCTRHDIRALAALDGGDSVSAFGAMLDGRADTVFEHAQLLAGVEHLLSPHQGLSRSFDTILAELGCADWLAVRLEAGPLLERWPEEATCCVALGHLESSYFAELEPAREALVRAIIAQPAEPEARARLSNWANDGSGPSALLRALVQSARAAQGGLLARQLAGEVVEQYADEPHAEALRLWALERLKPTGRLDEALRGEVPGLMTRVADNASELKRLEASWSTLSVAERRDALKTLEGRLAVDPNRTVDHLSIAVALVELQPSDRAAQSLYLELLDVAARLVISPSRDERLATALAMAPQLLGEAGCIAQAKFHLRHGQIEAALSASLQILDRAAASLRGLLWLFTLARRFRDPLSAARAIERASSAFRPAIRGVLEALAAELYLEAQAPEETLRLVSTAHRTNQNTARLVTLEIRLTEYFEPRSGIESIERALSKVLPSAALYRALSQAHQRIGEFDVALAWCHRACSLRPGDMALRNEQLQLALEVGEPARIVDILQDLMNQALPISGWVELAASAVAWLSSMDAARALEIGKRLLDHIGGTDRSLRAALLDAARANADEAFAIEVLERAAAVAPDSPSVHLVLAERRWARQEVDAALVAAWCAARAGAEPSAWVEYICVSTDDSPADAELTRLELSRMLLKREERWPELARVLRQLAVLRFDFAQDTDGAVDAWRELAELPDGDWGRSCRDMGEVLGSRIAARRIQEVAESQSGEARARVLGLAAQLSFEGADYVTARQLIELAVRAAPQSICLLPLAERIAEATSSPVHLESLYVQVEQVVLGEFGERSLHYRAARAFERMNAWTLALRHASLAFEIVPDDAAVWSALVRISRAANQPQILAVAAMRVAEAARDRAYSHRWLERAFHELSDSPDELRQKFDLAIRMLVGFPQVRGVHLVAGCIASLQRAGIEEVDFMRMRFERALESLMGELEGPDGARLGIAMSAVAAVELARFDLAAQSLFAALKADGDLEEFSQLSPVLQLASPAEMEAFTPTLQRALEWLERPYVHAGEEAIGLLTQIAVLLGDADGVCRIVSAIDEAARRSWYRDWTTDVLLPRLVGWGVAGRNGVLCLASSWINLGEPDYALDLLGRAVEAWPSTTEVDADSTVVSSEWRRFGEAYLRALDRVSVVERLAVLRQGLVRLERHAPVPVVARLRVALERRSADQRALCSALAEQAFVGNESPATRVQLLVEAARIAEGLGDLDGAMVYYRAALGTQRSSTVARMGLCTLMVRMDRYRTKEQAQALLELATDLELAVSEEQREVAVFVQAQALTVLERFDDVQRLLEAAESHIGPRALIVLGLAEQAVRHHQPALALGYYAAALGGNLHDLRARAEIALAAAHAAADVGDATMALQWLEPCLEDPSTRPAALVLQAELEGAVAAVLENARAADLSASTSEEPVELAASADPSSERTNVQRSEAKLMAARPSSGETVLQELALPRSDGAEPGSEAADPGQTAPSGVTAIEPGAAEFAILAAERIAHDLDQLRTWLPDGRRWLRQWPTSIRLVELVQQAARLEVHSSHAAALEQLLGVLRGDTHLTRPSDLADQPVDVDAVRTLLSRELSTPESEALALVWDGAEHEFFREASDYEVTGVMRLVGAASPLARTYAEVSRHFGVPKTPMFYKRTPHALATKVLLLNPPAALIEGELGADETNLAYRVGAALWATLPEHSLLFGMGRDRVSTVLRALVLAFGSTDGQPSPTQGESLRLAQVLWQTVRSRSQRRLKQICVAELDSARAWTAATQSLRRAGLYVCADLRVALRAAAAEFGIDAQIVHSSRCAEICEVAPELLDLFRFAASGEYADVRWQLGRPAQIGIGGRGS